MKWILRFIGIAIFLILLANINLSNLFEIIRNTNYWHLASSIALVILVLFIRACRWQFVLRTQQIQLPLKKIILFYLSSLFVGIITPGRVGDFSKTVCINQKGYSFGKAFFSSIVERFFDFLMLIFSGYIGMIGVSGLLRKQLIVLNALLLITVFALLIALMGKKSIPNILKMCFEKLMPKRHKAKLENGFLDFYKEFKFFNVKSYAIILVISSLAWVLYYALMYLLSLSLNINLTFIYTVICVSISAFVAMIPISFIGVGTRDAALIVLFEYNNLNRESAIAFSLMFVFVHLITFLISMGSWLVSPITIRKGQFQS